MKLHILSDIHIEFEDFEPPVTDADVVILAGDVHVGVAGLAWAHEHFAGKPVIYVPGNHEYYGQSFPALTWKLKDIARELGIHVLDRDRVIVDGVVFLGCTLWTDFALFGEHVLIKALANDSMSDYRTIQVNPEGRPLRAEDVRVQHMRSRTWIEKELHREAQRRQVVVITHHAPSMQSISPRDRSEMLSAAYASNLDTVVSNSGAALWVHGHVHDSNDYWLGGTRVLSNPKGYPRQMTRSNKTFRPDLVVEI